MVAAEEPKENREYKPAYAFAAPYGYAAYPYGFAAAPAAFGAAPAKFAAQPYSFAYGQQFAAQPYAGYQYANYPYNYGYGKIIFKLDQITLIALKWTCCHGNVFYLYSR